MFYAQVLSEKQQPKYSTESLIRKCCPHGKSYEVIEDGNEKVRKCTTDTRNFFGVSVLNATFYENCIEDNESGLNLSYTYVNACTFNNKVDKRMLLYGKPYGDLLYVLQNGSLLIVEENFDGYEIINSSYCLDVDRQGGFLYAIVCVFNSNFPIRVLRGEAYLYAVCLWISAPCLLLTAFFYLTIDELRDLHGKSLACHCASLALAYVLLGIVQMQQNVTFTITYFIQYFLLVCVGWLSSLCCDICIKIA